MINKLELICDYCYSLIGTTNYKTTMSMSKPIDSITCMLYSKYQLIRTRANEEDKGFSKTIVGNIHKKLTLYYIIYISVTYNLTNL